MSDTLKSILLAAVVLIGFAMIWAVTMPEQTNAWNGFGYWGGVFALWTIVSIGIYIGNKIADRKKKKGILPMLLLLVVSCWLAARRCRPKWPTYRQKRSYSPRRPWSRMPRAGRIRSWFSLARYEQPIRTPADAIGHGYLCRCVCR
jgi:hypothetical protein